MSISITVEDIEYAKKNYIPASISKNDLLFQDIFKKKLSIMIPGTPITDSRPRHVGHFYNPNKNALKKLFKPLYKNDKLLQNTCITYPHGIIIRAFVSPKKTFKKSLGNKKITKEETVALGLKDNDNLEKVHWDILQDNDFRIILNDSCTVKNITEKFYSNFPRIEIDILYSETYFYDCYEKSIKKSKLYIRYLLSEKYRKMNNINGKKLGEHFVKYIPMLEYHKRKKPKQKLMGYLNTNFKSKEIKDIIKYINKRMLTSKKDRNIISLSKYVLNKL